MMVDALVAIFVLLLAALSFFSLYPAVQKMHKMAQYESRAVQISTRLIEHLQLMKAVDVNATTLTQLNLIDTGQTASPYSFTNIPLDDASRYSPARALPNGTGTMTVTDLADGSKRIRIDISWRSVSGQTQTLRTGTMIGAYR